MSIQLRRQGGASLSLSRTRSAFTGAALSPSANGYRTTWIPGQILLISHGSRGCHVLSVSWRIREASSRTAQCEADVQYRHLRGRESAPYPTVTNAWAPMDLPGRRLYFAAMEGFTRPSEDDRELDELRRRAYGRNPDIGVDPLALARLRELEAAHRGDVLRRVNVSTTLDAAGANVAPRPAPASPASAEDQVAAEPSGSASFEPPPVKEASSWWSSGSRLFWRRATATRRSRIAWSVGGLVMAVGIASTVLLVSTRPDATLHLTGADADRQVRRLVIGEAPGFGIDASTLRAYGSYLGLEIWSAVNAFDSPCLVAVLPESNNVSELRCAPAAADLIMDVSSSGDGFEGFEGRPGEGLVRFMFRGDRVDAYVHLMPEAG